MDRDDDRERERDREREQQERDWEIRRQRARLFGPSQDDIQLIKQAVTEVIAHQAGTITAIPSDEDIRRICREVVRDVLGSISLDVQDFKAQAATAAEIAQWRQVNQTFGAVVKKVFIAAAAVIGSGIGAAMLFFLSHGNPGNGGGK